MAISKAEKKALAEVRQLINMLTKSEATEGDFEVIPLKNADAVEAANVLDEVFNGKPKQGGGKGGFGGFGGINPLSILQQMGGGDTKIAGSPTAERCSQLSAMARMRAAVVFPTPRGPAKR